MQLGTFFGERERSRGVAQLLVVELFGIEPEDRNRGHGLHTVPGVVIVFLDYPAYQRIEHASSSTDSCPCCTRIWPTDFSFCSLHLLSARGGPGS